MTLGEMISNKRKDKNLTQKDLADLLGVSSKTISKWETDRGYPEISMLSSLSKTLDVSVDKLLGGIEKPHSNTQKINYVINNASIISMLINVIGSSCFIVSLILLMDKKDWYWILTAIGVFFIFLGISTFFIIINNYKLKNDIDDTKENLLAYKLGLRRALSLWYIVFVLTVILTFFMIATINSGDEIEFLIFHSFIILLLTVIYLTVRIKTKKL